MMAALKALPINQLTGTKVSEIRKLIERSLNEAFGFAGSSKFTKPAYFFG